MGVIIVGLGNPGEEYQHTRHNVGWRVVETVTETHGFSSWHDDKTCHAKVADGVIGGGDAVAVLPQTFMNRSGNAVSCLREKYGADKPLIVVHDDIDLPRGVFRIAFGRGSGGHRGVESIANAIGGTDFARVRIGVSPTDADGNIRKPSGDEAVEKFVLGNLTGAEQEAFDALVPRIVEAIATMVADGHDVAMNRFN